MALSKKRVLEILSPAIKRSKCISLSCGDSKWWNKALNILRNSILKRLVERNSFNGGRR